MEHFFAHKICTFYARIIYIFPTYVHYSVCATEKRAVCEKNMRNCTQNK